MAELGLSGGYQLIDLSGLSGRLLLPEPSVAVEDVAGPTFKGTYSGLLKVFLDLLPYRGLLRSCALPMLVMPAPQHALAVDVQLRPLLVELGATVPTPGLAILESDLQNLGKGLRPWLSRVGQALSPSLAAGIPAVGS